MLIGLWSIFFNVFLFCFQPAVLSKLNINRKKEKSGGARIQSEATGMGLENKSFFVVDGKKQSVKNMYRIVFEHTISIPVKKTTANGVCMLLIQIWVRYPIVPFGSFLKVPSVYTRLQVA